MFLAQNRVENHSKTFCFWLMIQIQFNFIQLISFDPLVNLQRTAESISSSSDWRHLSSCLAWSPALPGKTPPAPLGVLLPLKRSLRLAVPMLLDWCQQQNLSCCLVSPVTKATANFMLALAVSKRRFFFSLQRQMQHPNHSGGFPTHELPQP